jgi:molybdopterin synthase catalytic subunit
VREYSDSGRAVRYLEYEAYPEMAEAQMRAIGAEIKRRWDIDDVAMVHRIGRLEIGEASVIIAVAAPHRGEAFDACEYAIDTLKATVPIWKKEVFADGEVWVGLQS